MTPTDERIMRTFLETRTIALVNASMKPERASHAVGNYLASAGYRVIPVNPGHAGEELFGETVVAHLKDIKIDVQMVDVFHRSDRILPIIEDAIEHLNGLKVIWMQLGIRHAEGRKIAEAKGITVFEDRCTAIEHRRLLSHRRAG